MQLRKVKLPVTSEEFDSLVDKLVKRHNFDKQQTVSILAQIIRFLPKDQMYVPMKHIIHSLLKVQANDVADKKLDELKLEYLIAEYNKDQSNPQVITALQKLADSGSQLAKDALAAPVIKDA